MSRPTRSEPSGERSAGTRKAEHLLLGGCNKTPGSRSRGPGVLLWADAYR